MLVIPRASTSELPLIRITNFWNYQSGFWDTMRVYIVGVGTLWEYIVGVGTLWEYIVGVGTLWEYIVGVGTLWVYIVGVGTLWGYIGYYLGITTDKNYQLLELPIRLVGIPNWLETFIRIARNYQHSELPIFGIFNRNTECEPEYGLRYGLGNGLRYGLGYGLK